MLASGPYAMILVPSKLDKELSSSEKRESHQFFILENCRILYFGRVL
jgi:hypothetical protein